MSLPLSSLLYNINMLTQRAPRLPNTLQTMRSAQVVTLSGRRWVPNIPRVFAYCISDIRTCLNPGDIKIVCNQKKHAGTRQPQHFIIPHQTLAPHNLHHLLRRKTLTVRHNSLHCISFVPSFSVHPRWKHSSEQRNKGGTKGNVPVNGFAQAPDPALQAGKILNSPSGVCRDFHSHVCRLVSPQCISLSL